jgi:hypothetical protein
MKRIVREVAVVACLFNDICSLQKELKLNDVDSIIPTLVYHHNISAQEAADAAFTMIAQSYQDFLAAKSSLRQAVMTRDSSLQRDVDTLIDGCMDVLVGNAYWTMHTRRYLRQDDFDSASNAFKIVL